MNRYDASVATQCANAALTIMECEIAQGATIDAARDTAKQVTITRHLTRNQMDAFNAVMDTVTHADIDGGALKSGRVALVESLEKQGITFSPFRRWVFIHIGLLL